MFERLFADHLVVREILNGAAFPLSIFLFLVVCNYLWNMFRAYGWGWTREPGVATACALAWVFFAESCRAGCVWYILRAGNNGEKISETFQVFSNRILMVAGVVLVLSLLRCTFIFTPPQFGNWTWIMSLFVTSVFLSFALLT